MGGQRAKLSRRLSDADAIRLFAEHHIVQVRRKKNGEIVLVKHCTWGWVAPPQYYALQQAHAMLPLLEKVVEGGYRLKQALWSASFEVEVLATGVKLPLGLALFAGASALAAIDGLQGKPAEATLDLLSLALPFGEIWLLYRGVAAFADINKATNDAVSQFDITPPPGTSHYVGYWPLGHWE